MKSLLVLALVLLAGFPAQAAVLKTSSDVDRVAIRLGDVFAGLPEGVDTDIAIAPAPGKSVTYDVNVLTQLAQQYQLDWKATGLTDQCVLSRASVAIDTNKILSAIEDRVRSEAVGQKEARIAVQLDVPTFALYLTKGNPASFILSHFTYDQRGRRFRTEIIAGNQENPTVVSLSGRIFVQREVPVLSRRLEAGAVVTASDVSSIYMDADRMPIDIITARQDLVGRELVSPYAEAMPLRAKDIRAPRLVTRGSMVTMRIETPAMLVTAQGRALQEGALGDTVRMINTRSNRIVEGRISAYGTVDIAINQMDQPLRNASAGAVAYQ